MRKILLGGALTVATVVGLTNPAEAKSMEPPKCIPESQFKTYLNLTKRSWTYTGSANLTGGRRRYSFNVVYWGWAGSPQRGTTWCDVKA